MSIKLRGLTLFSNFFFIILAYYQVKPASRSIFLEHFHADQLPYVWIGSALFLGLMMPFYSRLVTRLDRRRLVILTCLLFSFLLVGFGIHFKAGHTGAIDAAAFYILIDILGVVLVEQFWSVTNSSYTSATGSRWYGVVGSGGLAGGLVGGALASWLLKSTPLLTHDLLLVSAIILACIGLFTAILTRLDIYSERNFLIHPPGLQGPFSFRKLLCNRYLLLIFITILLAQFAEPVVEYQFMSFVEQSYSDQELRTAYLSAFLATLGGVALFINLVITPLVLRGLGTLAGMLVQPALLAITSVFFYANAGLMSAAIMKISDRGLSYSINRASKEMLYVPVDPRLIHCAKAWIDMFGYRLFKIAGSVLVLALTQWFGLYWAPANFSLIVIPACLVWTGVVLALREDYGHLRRKEAESQPLLT